jgi:hypothetical protein
MCTKLIGLYKQLWWALSWPIFLEYHKDTLIKKKIYHSNSSLKNISCGSTSSKTRFIISKILQFTDLSERYWSTNRCSPKHPIIVYLHTYICTLHTERKNGKIGYICLDKVTFLNLKKVIYPVLPSYLHMVGYGLAYILTASIKQITDIHSFSFFN